MFISQDNANEILNFDNGNFVVDITPTSNIDIFTTNILKPQSSYKLFNGVYSDIFNPTLLYNSLNYYSFMNLYSIFFKLDTSSISSFYNKVAASNLNLIIEAIALRDQLLFDAYNVILTNSNIAMPSLTRDLLKS